MDPDPEERSSRSLAAKGAPFAWLARFPSGQDDMFSMYYCLKYLAFYVRGSCLSE